MTKVVPDVESIAREFEVEPHDAPYGRRDLRFGTPLPQ